MAVFPAHSVVAAPRSLADTLSQGPLSLGAALRIANDIAVELRDLHLQSRAYGKVTLDSIVLTDAGARLLPLRGPWEKAVPERDIHGFGLVFHQMLHGATAPATLTAASIHSRASHTGIARLRAASTKLALRCLATKGARLSMQQVATEIRLISVMHRQEDAGVHLHQDARTGSPSAGVSQYTAPTTWTPPVAMLIDVAGAIPLPIPAPVHETETPIATDDEKSEPAAPIVPLSPASFGSPAPKAPPTEVPAAANCPKCNCSVVYLSRARSSFEHLLERINLPIVRCHRCYHRYFAIGRLKFSKEMPVGGGRKIRPYTRHE